MSLDNVSVFLDKYGFVQNAMIAGEPPEGSIFAPPVNGFQELFDYAYFFENGAWSSLGPSPGVNYVLDKANKVWILDIEGAKARKWAQIKHIRKQRELAPFTVNGNTYDADKARISGAVQLALLAQMADQPFTINWTLADNSVVSLDGAAVIAVGTALGAMVNSVHDIARSLRMRIDMASTIEEIEAIAWPS